jgi:hypothetical protein
LLANPGHSPSDWRGIIATDGEALTLSRDARELLPRYLMARFLSDNTQGLKKLSDKWDALQPRLSALHAALGGSSNTLAAIGAIATDPAGHAAFSSEISKQKFEHKMSALARKIDNSHAFKAFADWLDEAVQGCPRQPSKLHEFKPWDRLRLCWSFKSGDAVGADERVVRDVIETLPGLDAGPPASFTWNIWPGMTSSEATIVSLAEQTAEEELKLDDMYGKIVTAVAEQGFEYDGLTHAEATTVYAEAGDPFRALGTLTASAWWITRRQGRPAEAIRDGLHLLCDNNGWQDLHWVAQHESDLAK